VVSYTKKYGNIERVDRILKAEGDSPDNYKVSKQPDVCMLFYLLTNKELEEIFQGLGYPFDENMIQKNIEYYLLRTTHGSTMSKMIFSYILSPFDKKLAWKTFVESAHSDIDDTQGGTTGEGVHLALMAGTVYTFTRMYGGVDTSQELLIVNPDLPAELDEIKFSLHFRGVLVKLSIGHNWVKARASRNLFPIVIQGTLMMCGLKPFTRRISPTPIKCTYCGSCDYLVDNYCRSCGRNICANCLFPYTVWNDALNTSLNIKICRDCRQSINFYDVKLISKRTSELTLKTDTQSK